MHLFCKEVIPSFLGIDKINVVYEHKSKPYKVEHTLHRYFSTVKNRLICCKENHTGENLLGLLRIVSVPLAMD